MSIKRENPADPKAAPGDKAFPDPIPLTCADALARWDAGQSVFTVELGGVGPGYEQTIQILVFELLRAALPVPLAELTVPRFEMLAEPVIAELNGQLGFSGAQVGAARSLAFAALHKGWRALLRSVEAGNRLIQVKKTFPKWERSG